MNDAKAGSGLPTAWSPFLLALAAIAALVAYAALLAFPSPGAQMPLMAPVAAGAFALFQLLFPATRPTRAHVLSPLNWAVFAFFLKLVAMPLAISWSGMAMGTLPRLPSAPFVDESIGLSIIAFGAFSAGYALQARFGRPARSGPAARIPRGLIVAYVAMGVIGILLRFGSFGAMFATLGDPGKFADIPVEPGSVTQAASTFLRPFLIGGIVMGWCVWVERRGAASSALVRLLGTVAAGVAVILVGATYSLNRGSFMVPLVAVATAYSVHVRRLSVAALGTTAAVLLALSVVAGQYRTGDATTAELVESSQKREDVLVPKDTGQQVQVYANAPQFAGFLLEAGERGQQRFTPRVLLGSLLYSVPILGKPFRDESGPALYNRMIYGEPDIVDQIIPFEAEVWLCLGPVGLIGSFLLLGAFVSRLQRAFEAARGTFESYALQFTAIWATFLVQGSLAVVSQVFVFFGWPIYVYALLRPWLTAGDRRAPSPEAAAPGALASSR